MRYRIREPGPRTATNRAGCAVVGQDRTVVDTSVASETVGMEWRQATDEKVISLITKPAE